MQFVPQKCFWNIKHNVFWIRMIQTPPGANALQRPNKFFHQEKRAVLKHMQMKKDLHQQQHYNNTHNILKTFTKLMKHAQSLPKVK